jgi:hypothetical protein
MQRFNSQFCFGGKLLLTACAARAAASLTILILK